MELLNFSMESMYTVVGVILLNYKLKMSSNLYKLKQVERQEIKSKAEFKFIQVQTSRKTGNHTQQRTTTVFKFRGPAKKDMKKNLSL